MLSWKTELLFLFWLDEVLRQMNWWKVCEPCSQETCCMWKIMTTRNAITSWKNPIRISSFFFSGILQRKKNMGHYYTCGFSPSSRSARTFFRHPKMEDNVFLQAVLPHRWLPFKSSLQIKYFEEMEKLLPFWLQIWQPAIGVFIKTKDNVTNVIRLDRRCFFSVAALMLLNGLLMKIRLVPSLLGLREF